MTDDIDPPKKIVEEALLIPMPVSTQLVLRETRQLTGPGMLWEHCGAVLDVYFKIFDPDQIISIWNEHARLVLDSVGWGGEQLTSRKFSGGLSLAISAPIDQLKSAVFVVQTAWHFSATQVLDQPSGDFSKMIDDLKRMMADEANPQLIEIIEAADRHKINVLYDGEEITLGQGAGAMVWQIGDLPELKSIDWDELYNVPVALITGTNGKTTTAKLCAAITAASGITPGLASANFVRIGDTVFDREIPSAADCAKVLLRDERLEIAYLELDRNDIVPSGLPVPQAQAALVTNIAADRLGGYGIMTVGDLATAKLSVHRSLNHDGVLVLNADDKYVVAQAEQVPSKICWFSLNPKSTKIVQARSHAHTCAWFDGTSLIFFDGKEETAIVNVSDVPITMNGNALHNVRNALAALCLSKALGLGDEAIELGLSGFNNDYRNNPGRCNEFEINGARVFIDFADNQHSVAAVSQALRSVRAARVFVMISHMGDRSDGEIRSITEEALKIDPDMVVAAELEEHLHGREHGEVSAVAMDVCANKGLSLDDIMLATSPANGVAYILRKLQPGDMAMLFVLSEREKIFELLGVKNW